jgi:hypothetical protein
MSGDMRAAAAADAMQAEYFKSFLEQELSESAARLAALNRRLTQYMTSGQTTHISHLLAVIRAAEDELHGIERMVHALRRRFPEGGDSAIQAVGPPPQGEGGGPTRDAPC